MVNCAKGEGGGGGGRGQEIKQDRYTKITSEDKKGRTTPFNIHHKSLEPAINERRRERSE